MTFGLITGSKASFPTDYGLKPPNHESNNLALLPN